MPSDDLRRTSTPTYYSGSEISEDMDSYPIYRNKIIEQPKYLFCGCLSSSKEQKVESDTPNSRNNKCCMVM